MQTNTPNGKTTMHFNTNLKYKNTNNCKVYGVHAARPQRAHGALEDPTTLPQRCHSVLSNSLCKRQAAAFVLSMFKISAAAWRSRRLHSVSTALLAFARRSAIYFKRCENAVRTPLWCDRGLTYTTCILIPELQCVKL